MNFFKIRRPRVELDKCVLDKHSGRRNNIRGVVNWREKEKALILRTLREHNIRNSAKLKCLAISSMLS